MVTRRTLIATGISAAGIGLIATSQPTNANVTLKSLSIPDQSKSVTSDVQDVIIATTFDWSFSSNTSMDGVTFQLRAGTTTDDLEPISGIRYSSPGTSDNGTEQLSGSILEHPGLDASMFDPASGESVSQGVVVEIGMLLERNNTIEHEATAQASPVISVSDESITVESSIDGSGGATVVE